MPRYKSVLKNCVIETAKRRRRCRHDKSHSIVKGQKCLVVHEGTYQRYGYCSMCAKEMLRAAEGRIKEIAAQLSDKSEIASL